MAKGSIGMVQRITGPVVDVSFNIDEIPEILHALEIEVHDEVYVLEVNKETNDASKSDIFEVIQKEFGRTISPIEYEIIKAWIESGINQDVIKEAVKEATFNGVSNLRYIDKSR